MNSLFKTVTCANDTNETVPFEQTEHKIKQQIFIQNLEIEMFIGVLEDEKKQKQRVIINVTLDVIPSQNWQADNIDDVVSYADVVQMIKAIAQDAGHILLVETFANMIAEECLKMKPVQVIDLKISKPDIMPGVDGVGVNLKITR